MRMQTKWYLVGGLILIEIVGLFASLWQQGLTNDHRKRLNPNKATLRNRWGQSTLTQSFCSVLGSIVWDRLHRAQQKGPFKATMFARQFLSCMFFWVSFFPGIAVTVWYMVVSLRCWMTDAIRPCATMPLGMVDIPAPHTASARQPNHGPEREVQIFYP